MTRPPSGHARAARRPARRARIAASAARRAVAGIARRAASSVARARRRASAVAIGHVKLATAVPRQSMYPAQPPLFVPLFARLVRLFLRLVPLLLTSLLILGRPATAGDGADASAPLDANEQALLDVRDAALRRDEAGARSLALRIDPAHPLAAYPDFWRLRMLLDDRTQIPDPAALDAEIARFIAAHAGTVVADRL